MPVRSLRRRIGKVVLWVLAIVLLVPVLAIATILLALNTNPGRNLATTELARLTGDMVRLQGLSGRFPDRLRLGRLELRDDQGTWLTVENVALDWSPLALVHKQALIHRLDATRLDLPRLPASNPNAKPSPPDQQPFTLPVRIILERLNVARAALGAPLLGYAAVASLQGHADLPTLETGNAAVQIDRQDAPGNYTLTGTVTDQAIDAHLAVNEPEGGLIAQLATLPNVGALAIKADIAGPRAALATTIGISAGPLTANADGTIDLDGSRLALDVTANAPAMRPADGVAWGAIALQAHVAGPFTTPDASGHLQVDALQAQGATLQRLAADLAGNAGQVTVKALVSGLHIPGPRPDLLAAAPIAIDLAARLDDSARPVRYSLSHPLVAIQGTANTAGNLIADATLSLPDLAPLTEIANLDIGGATQLDVHAAQARTGTPEGTTTLTADGTVSLVGGPAHALAPPWIALIGPAGKISLSARTAGSTVTVSHASIDGAALTLAASGQTTPAGVDATARLGLSNLALVAPTLTGQATLDAHVTGPLDTITLDAVLAGDVGAPGVSQGPVRLTAHATGLPTAPAGHLEAVGTLAGAPLDLALDATRDAAGAVQATIQRADWRSLHAEGALRLAAGATIPQGHVSLRFPTLADLRPLIGQPISGGIDATLDIDPTAATLDAELRNAGLPGTHVGRAVIKARVADPLAHPVVAATLTADGIDAAGTTGSARVEANGPQDALAIRTTANLVASGIPAQIAATALLDAGAKQVRVNTLQVDAKPPGVAGSETLRLVAPATIRFADGVAVDRIRLGVRQATLEVAGRLSPTLDTTITLRTPADIASIAGPDLAFDGTLALDAKLTGTAAKPDGSIKLTATGLRARTGPGRTIPAASITANAALSGGTARIDARLIAGTANLAVNGQAPVGAGALDLRATGGLDLALLDPILTAQGRRVRGRVTLDVTAAGSTAAPRITGQAQLANGEVQDFTQGLRLSNLAAIIRAEGQTLRIASFTGRAGPGTIGVSGTVGVLAPGLPVDLTITARNARPLASDTVSADIDADLTVKGEVANGLQAGGKVTIRRADLAIPNTLPASVVVLDVRRPGEKAPPPTAPAAPIGLDLTIAAPGQIFLRGRGIDAEMAGTLTIRGTSTQPQVGGGLEMRRGSIAVAGTTLTFSRGKVGFDGTGVSGKIDPTLDFAADSTSSGVTATLTISGYVSKPKITLSSVPDLPQDEVLAYLIFKRSAKDLGPFQIAQIAAGLVELTGVGGGGGFNPLETVRKGLGLDRLSVGSSSPTIAGSRTTGTSSTANTPTVEAGRYVANGVYVGAKQGTSGNQTQATVQIDITKGLKLETDVGSGQGGNQVGVTYQFEY